jgi:hypothetical protein
MNHLGGFKRRAVDEIKIVKRILIKSWLPEKMTDNLYV